MKIIYPEKQSAISATSFDPNYPAANLIDNDIPSKLWKADDTNTATLTVTLDSGSQAVAVFNTNAESVTITAKDNGGGAIKTDTFSLSGTRTYDRCWLEYTQENASHSATIALTAAAGTTVSAGIVRAGTIVDLPNPAYGIQEGRKDFSIVKELNNGALYIKKRNLARSFSVDLVLARASEFYNLTDVCDYYGPNPLAILLVEDITDEQWCVYGHMLDPFQGGHSYPSNSTITLSIQEAT